MILDKTRAARSHRSPLSSGCITCSSHWAIPPFPGCRDAAHRLCSATVKSSPLQHRADLVLFLFLPLDVQKSTWLCLLFDFSHGSVPGSFQKVLLIKKSLKQTPVGVLPAPFWGSLQPPCLSWKAASYPGWKQQKVLQMLSLDIKDINY